ncbi:hypothetical protein [Thioalkalivibrio sp. XN8]|uniref:hypothetical protein n=1 Tax=Thioalkalivibrio sp. XN8 TaxID=2712863 RepID=UPI0013ED1C88|nr:hypothetical protein [Thioalkalivibrio sp. XN8]NGP54442.1 hypothetical protein [Thioalkalivibrio sp. XN8]
MSRKHAHLNVEQLSDGNTLPLEIAWRWSGGSLIAIFGLAAIFLVLAFMAGELIPENAFGEHTAPVKALLPVALIVVASRRLWRGLAGWKTESRAVIDGRSVTVTTKRWLKSHQWSEPLANYNGVRWQRYKIQTSTRDVPVTRDEQRFRHVIELVHPDEAKTIPLAVKTTGRRHVLEYLIERATTRGAARRSAHHAAESDLRPLWETLAASLGLPAIDARDGASEVRQAVDLDKSIRQMADEGSIAVDWNDNAPPPSLAVEQRGSADDPASQELHLTVHAASLPKPVFYILGGMGGFFLFLGVWNLEFRPVFAGLLLGGVAFGIWYLQRKNPNRIIITRKEVRHEDRLVQRRSFVIPLSDIESISVRDRDSELTNARTLKLSGKHLLLSTDNTERTMGAGLKDDELEWLRGYLVAAIARA